MSSIDGVSFWSGGNKLFSLYPYLYGYTEKRNLTDKPLSLNFVNANIAIKLTKKREKKLFVQKVSLAVVGGMIGRDRRRKAIEKLTRTSLDSVAEIKIIPKFR